MENFSRRPTNRAVIPQLMMALCEALHNLHRGEELTKPGIRLTIKILDFQVVDAQR
jgi:hypothetical protein